VTKHEQRSREDQSDSRQRKPKAPSVETLPPISAQQSLVGGAVGADLTEGQARLLGRVDIPLVQRQAMAQRIQRGWGNRHLQRVLARITKPSAPTVQRQTRQERQAQYQQMVESTQTQAGVMPDFPQVYGQLMNAARQRSRNMSWETWQELQNNEGAARQIIGNIVQSTFDMIRDDFLDRVVGEGARRAMFGSPLTYAQGLQMIDEESRWNARDRSERQAYRQRRLYAYLLWQLAYNLAGQNIRQATRINQLLITQTNNYREWERVFRPVIARWVTENVPPTERGPGMRAAPSPLASEYAGQPEDPEAVEVSEAILDSAEEVVELYWIAINTANDPRGVDETQMAGLFRSMANRVMMYRLEDPRVRRELQAAILRQPNVGRNHLDQIMSIILSNR
jgi:hypothetical protein